ncbi:MAG: glycosyltransferase [Planctomycetes bacterium]|nr:glycosyltransferase [Planctomycetota bacterium]
MDLSILIVNWNTKDLLDECLASIKADASGLDVETIVVDNASSDGSPERVREKHPDAILIENDENKGFAAANNQAFGRATGKYVLMLNSDTVVRPGALKRMVEFMDEHAEAGAAGCRLVNPDGTNQHSVRGFPSFAAAFYQFTALRFLRVGKRAYRGYRNKGFDFDKEQEVESPMGAAILFRREVLEALGFLDADYFMYYEEVDICRRLIDAGHKIYYVPDAVVMHYGGRSARQDRARLSPVKLQSMMTYFTKHEGAGRTALFKAVFYPLMFLRLLIEIPAELVGAMVYATIKGNPYKARRCVDALRGKSLQIAGATEARGILLLLAFAFLVRVLTSILTVCVTKDAATFLTTARHIQDRGLASAVETVQHPLFPLLMAGFQTLFGRMVFQAQLFCSFLSALTVVPLYFLTRDVFGKTVARLTCVIFAVHGVVVCNAVDVATEPAYMLFYVTSLAFGLRAIRKESGGRFFASGLASGLAYLTRPEGLGAAIIVGGWVGLLALVRIRRGGLKLIPGGAALAAGAAIFVLPFMGINDWRLTPKKKVEELVKFEENPARYPHELIPEKPPEERVRYHLRRMREWGHVFLKTGHVWLMMIPFAVLLRRTVKWGGLGELFLLSAAGFNFFLCYAVIIVFGYLSDRHLMTGAVLLMPWMAIGVEEILASLSSKGRLRRVVAALGGVALIALAVLVVTEDFTPRRRDRQGIRTAGLWIARHLPDRTICGTLVPRVATYAHTEYTELANKYPLYDVVDLAREAGAGVVVINTDDVQRVTPNYDLDKILRHKRLRERFRCPEGKGAGKGRIIVLEVLPEKGHD